MLHHPGEIIAIFKPSDKNVKSADNDTIATVKMWDDNVLTLVVDSKISTDIKEGDKVLVDYRPHNIGSNQKPAIVQKQLISKIIKGDRAEAVWKEYKRWYASQKQKATQKAMQQNVSDYMG
jgi:hypothetical protein